MNTTPENTLKPKRIRALPRVWRRFIYLEPGDHFFIGRCRYIKRGFFGATTFPITARRITVLPWRKVQTVDRMVVNPHWITPAEERCPGGPSIGNPGVSGYVGDDRPGRTPRITESAIGETGQPHSDNNVSGTSS